MSVMFARAARMAELELKLRGFSKTGPAGGQFGAAFVRIDSPAARSRRRGEDILDSIVDDYSGLNPIGDRKGEQ